MTDARYRNYRRALARIDIIEESSGDREATALLRESAQDLLLSRDTPRDGDDPLEAAALVLTQLLVTGAISRSQANAVMEPLHASGPERVSIDASEAPLSSASP